MRNIIHTKVTLSLGITIIASLITPFCSFSQTLITAHGFVTDKNNKPLPVVTVSILSVKDSSLVKASLTDSTGKFKIGLEESGGGYLFAFSLIGYQKKYVGPLTAIQNQDIALGTTVLEESVTNLSAVTVSSKKPIVEVNSDKTIINVQQSIVATGSSAFELLQKSPGIQMDDNDNISVKGKKGVKIFVDGRMMELDNKDIAAYLKSINSNDIEAIELISNPGAKYDAGGNAGVINLRLKKDMKYGTNGSINLGIIDGATPKENVSADMNYRHDKINIFGSIGGSLGIYQTDFNLRRVQLDTLYNEKTVNKDNNKTINAKTGVDFRLNDKNTLGIMVTTNYTDADHTSSGITPIDDGSTGAFIKTLRSYNSIPGSRSNADFNLNYHKQEDSGTNINFDADYGLFRSRGNDYQPNYYYGPDNNLLYSIINSMYNPTNINIYTAKLDLTKKIRRGKLEYGAKVSWIDTKNSFDFFLDSAGKSPLELLNQSSNFSYKENVNAAYGSYEFKASAKLTIQTGLRIEQTNSETNLIRADGIIENGDDIKKNYIDFFPTISFTWVADQNNTFNLTGSRRIDRPTYQDLNPFEVKMDQLTYFKGNPFLLPQYTDNVNLSHTFLGKLNTSIGFSYVTHLATEISDTVGNALYAEPKNIGTQKIISFSIGSPLTITNWWSGYGNIWYSYQLFNTAIGKDTIRINVPIYGLNLQQSFVIGKDYSAEISGWFNGPSLTNPEWHLKSMGGLDLGLQKRFFSRHATVKLSATDILNTAKIYVQSNVGGVNGNGSLLTETRTLRLSFTWRFGSNQVDSSRDRKTGLENEEKRIKNSN